MDSTTSWVGASPTDSEAIIFAQGLAGGGIAAMADDIVGTAQQVTLIVDVRDLKGNELNTELTLSIE